MLLLRTGKMQQRAEELRKRFLMICSVLGLMLSRWEIIHGIKKKFMILSMTQII